MVLFQAYTWAETWFKVWGDGVGALAPKIFFAVPQIAKFGGTAGGLTVMSLGTKCWLSVGHFMARCRLGLGCLV